jgi:uncharacterized protein with WD repeat
VPSGAPEHAVDRDAQTPNSHPRVRLPRSHRACQTCAPPPPRRCRFDSFWSFEWRPRPPSLLPAEKERDILRTLKSYAKKYDEQDELLLAAADTELLAKRARKKAEWEEYMAGKAEWLKEAEAHLVEVLGALPEEPKFSLQETDVQQIIDVREEPYVA